jgi:hypothetical protein
VKHCSRSKPSFTDAEFFKNFIQYFFDINTAGNATQGPGGVP